MPIFPALLAINPEVDKYNYVESFNNRTEYYSEQNGDLKDTFYLCRNGSLTKVDFIDNELKSFLTSSDLDLKISTEVYNSSYYVISHLYPSQYSELKVENIYPTEYGTIILDWEKDNGDVFSLEIGARTLGYFIENNNIDEKQVDEVDVKNSTTELLRDLSNFLSK